MSLAIRTAFFTGPGARFSPAASGLPSLVASFGIALLLLAASTSCRAEFLLLTPATTTGGVAANEIQGWPTVAAFLAGGGPVHRYGVRPGSAEVSMRFITTDPGGELLTMQAATGTDGTYDLYRWRDPIRFASNEGAFVITRYNIGKLAAITGDGGGRIFVVEELGGSTGSRTYQVKRWDSIAAFSSYQQPVIVGQRSGIPDLQGIEFIEGQLYGLHPVMVNGQTGCAVRRWRDFTEFLAGPGELIGTREFAGQIIELFSAAQAAPPAQPVTARAPMWPWLGNKLPADTPGLPGGYAVVDAFPNLTFQNPVKMLPRPGTSGELWVAGREGFIWAFVNHPASTVKTMMLDLSATTLGWGDSGLLGFAFHPEFGQAGSPNRGYVYVAYNFIPAGADTGPGRSYNRLSRFNLADGAANISRASEYVLINQFDRHPWHNQGDLVFGADGFLYLAVGDEGALDNEYGNAQKLDGGLFSGVLRIDVDQDAARSHPIRRQPQAGGAVPAGWPGTYTQGYFIPNDNPWLDADGSVLEEFWAVGLRNPYRMSRDPVSGRVFIGEVGQTSVEEINVLTKGANYEWAQKEGSLAGPSAAPASPPGTLTPPYWSYRHQDGNRCVIGGHVYRGSAHAGELAGQYVFGDFVSGRVWAMRWQGLDAPEVRQIATSTGYSLTGFGLDHHQELYLLSLGYHGRVLKLERQSAPPPPATLSATGAFANLTNLTPAPGVLPFAVNAPLWSDNSAKQRWIALPNNGAPYSEDERVTFRADSEWDFPAGTVTIKHFELPVSDSNPALRRRLETRFMVKARDGTWYGITYKWRADGSDAELLADGLTETIAIATASGGTRQQTWTYPSRSDCLQCHNSASTQVLGLRTWQLNGSLLYPGDSTPTNQLLKWSQLELFDATLTGAQIAGFRKSAALADASASMETRARSYLDANCAHCHRPGGAQAQFDARFNTALPQQGLIDATPANALGIANARLVAPGAVERSLLHWRMTLNGASQMPPLGRHVVDEAATELVARWIRNLTPPAAPDALLAAADYGVVALTWTPAASNADGFLLRRGVSGQDWSTLGSAGATVTSFQDFTAAATTDYVYQIAAFNEAGISSWTSSAAVTTWAMPGSWDDWRQHHALGGLNGPLDNPDGDSAPNLLEFALGANPASGGSAQDHFLVRHNPVTGHFDAQVIRPNGLSGVTMTLQVAAHPGRPENWSAAALTPVATSNPNGTHTLVYPALDSLPAQAAAGRGFARLQVTLNATGEIARTAAWFWERRAFPVGHRTLGLSVMRAERFSGRVTSGSSQLHVAASAGDFSVRSRLDPARAAFVEVVEGAHEGHRFEVDVSSTTAGMIALNADSPRNTLPAVPDLAGARIVVRAHWTLADLFPPAAWRAGTSASTADRVHLFDASAQGWITYWLVELPQGRRWTRQGSASLQDEGGLVIPPGLGLMVQKSGGTVIAPMAGVLRPHAFALPVTAPGALLAGGWPMEQSPADRAMLVSDGFIGSSNPAQADRFLLWEPDLNPSASPGFATWFLLNGGTHLRYWTRLGTAKLGDDNANPLFPTQRAFMLRLQSDRPGWRLPLPWLP